jgi:hypothetical protein
MTDPRKDSFGPYVRSLADLMGLRDWKVTIGDGGARDDSAASVWLQGGVKNARIHLSEEFLGYDADRQRQTLVHELVHAHFAASDGMLMDWLDDARYKGYVRIFEYAVDGIAEEWAKFLPLPNEGIEEDSASSNGKADLPVGVAAR